MDCKIYKPIIKKKEYVFILNETTKKYHRLTKREFTLEEIEKFGEIKTKQTIHRKSLKDEKNMKKEDFYNRAIADYPEELKKLMIGVTFD